MAEKKISKEFDLKLPKNERLVAAIERISKDIGDGSIMRMGDTLDEKIEAEIEKIFYDDELIANAQKTMT